MDKYKVLIEGEWYVLELADIIEQALIGNDLRNNTMRPFTGTLDNHSVEVYELDVLTVEGKGRYHVEYDNLSSAFKLRTTTKFQPQMPMSAVKLKGRVIGNYIDNPELVEL